MPELDTGEGELNAQLPQYKITNACSLFAELIAVVDVGSPEKGRLGWAILPVGITGGSIGELVHHVAAALLHGPVSLGFEAPLWVPLRLDPMKLTRKREGEGSRPWSANAGAAVLATGLAVVPHILQEIRKAAPRAIASMNYRNPPNVPGSLFVWEAFVSREDKGEGHEEDALLAARSFEFACTDLAAHQRIPPEQSLNLLGAALLRTGWTSDVSVLGEEVLVLKQLTRTTREER
ncbi:MAG: hypothetical protein U1E15_07840 [Hyphomicrobiales bacterium]